MVAVGLIGADLAYIRGPIDVNLLFVVPFLQVGLFRVLSPRGRIRTFWFGFEASGWAGVVAILSGVGPFWFRFLDAWLDEIISRIAEGHPAAGRAVAMALYCEGTPIEDTLPGLMPMSFIAGMPILILATIGGRLAVAFSSRTGGSRPTRGAAPEV